VLATAPVADCPVLATTITRCDGRYITGSAISAVMRDVGLDTDQVGGHPDLAILRAHEAPEAGTASGFADASRWSELADDRLVHFPSPLAYDDLVRQDHGIARISLGKGNA